MPDSTQNQRRTQVTFIDLISLIAGVVACSCIVATARNAGRLDVFISWIVGLFIGFGSLWGTRVAMRWVVFRLKLHEPNLSPLRLTLSFVLCLIAIIWIVISGFTAALLTGLVISNVK